MNFYATTQGEEHRVYYYYSPEDIQQLDLKSVDYDTSTLSFTFSLKNAPSNVSEKVSLKFSREDYFKRIIQLNRAEISKWHITGAYSNIDVFLQGMLNYDRDNIVVEKQSYSAPILNFSEDGGGDVILHL